MSAFLIRKGDVLQTNAEIAVLEQHAKRRVRVASTIVLVYLNDSSTLYINYTDGAVGMFSGSSASDLREWADTHKKWPKCDVKSVHAHSPKLIAKACAPVPKERPPRLVRTRKPPTKRITRVRK